MQTNKVGLTSRQAEEILSRDGPNVTRRRKNTTFAKKFLSQFGDLMIVILLVASALSFAVAIFSGETADLFQPIIIVAIVVANALLGAIQEHRAEKSLDALQKLTTPKTKVYRDGNLCQIDSERVVIGDLCLFETGDVVTADALVVEGESLFVNQSTLTGESLPVEKEPTVTRGNPRQNQIFSGSFVTKGRCLCEVFATGGKTELGKIADMLDNSAQGLTPLQHKLKQLSKTLGVVCLVVCLVVLILGFVKGLQHREAGQKLTDIFVSVFLTSVSLAVAAIPEGLPAVVTVVLAKGIVAMSNKNAVVKRLTAVEALGSATVICTDKTGTLTQNKMTLVGVFDGQRYILAEKLPKDCFLLQSYVWCCDAIKNQKGWLGDPTEIAVSSVAQMTKGYKRICEIPFDSARKLMTVVVAVDGQLYAITKGSLEKMTTASNYRQFEKQHNLYAKKGLRVLALSVRQIEENFDKTRLESNLEIVGLFTIADPPRKEAKQAVATCRQAGIRPVMITGDSLDTACEIAKQIGIMGTGDLAVDGDTLSRWSDKDLSQRVHKIAVYARATPADKLRIVNAWQSHGEVVAMTGDGVNDAPALKKADIGCAMGSGTEVAKDSADIILADDNFATIVHAVSLGRSVYDNIKKSVTYLLTCNIGEVLSVFVALLVWDISPLSAMQLLWINLVTDGLPSLALGVYKQERGVMSHRSKNQSFFADGGGVKIVVGGVLFGAVTLVGYALGNRISYLTACTMAYLILSLSQLFFALEMRSNRGLFEGGMTKLMAVSMLVSFALVWVVAFTPLFQRAFGLVTLSGGMYAIAVALSLAPTLLYEVYRQGKRLLWKDTNLPQNGSVTLAR